ncbi:hypothetical protein Y1Q_0004334 [Alligator mississippiensis]|uniref:Uncharacterized protein n=1 Tax=Alligator mississippiensis TaxID=8496 RepID=A0A151MIH3_ALLMI|nr:hypothetical protein Y1Q_0004334 [Alligator mississippiensis]
MDVEVVGCMKMALSELQTYHQKAVAEDGEDTANATWHRDMWHRTMQPPPRLTYHLHCNFWYLLSEAQCSIIR